MTMDRFAVIGDPVSHSLSPYIHQAFAAQQSMKITYEKIRVTNDAFKETVLAFQAAGFKGINITQPHKEKAYQLADDIMPHAGLSKAVNTLTFADSIIGDNTDGLGLVIDLQHNLHISLQDKRILVFGAGGVARGIIPSLLTEKPAELCLVNRTAAKAKALMAEFAILGPIREIQRDELMDERFDLIINAVSATVDFTAWSIPQACFHGAIVYNVNYGPAHVDFHSFIKKTNASSYYAGEGMLVEQAAQAFTQWHGFKPTTRAIIQWCQNYFMR